MEINWDPWLSSSYYNPINLIQGLGSLATAFALFYAFKQNKSGKVQQFETTLFNLIELHNNIVSNLSYKMYNYDEFSGHYLSEDNYVGRQVFMAAKQTLVSTLSHEIIRTYDHPDSISFTSSITEITTLEQAERVFKESYYSDYYENFESELNHYFRNLYHIIKYIDQSSLINKNQKKFYTSIVRAQLSQNELHIWFFNAMHDKFGYPNALYLINKYNMMRNFANELVSPAIWLTYFNSLLDKVKKSKI